jgi:hypothetical protein
MNKDDIKKQLQENILTVTFIKKDGTERTMRCTLQESYLPTTKVRKKENATVLSVWDLDKLGWRSFRVDSIKTIA